MTSLSSRREIVQSLRSSSYAQFLGQVNKHWHCQAYLHTRRDREKEYGWGSEGKLFFPPQQKLLRNLFHRGKKNNQYLVELRKRTKVLTWRKEMTCRDWHVNSLADNESPMCLRYARLSASLRYIKPLWIWRLKRLIRSMSFAISVPNTSTYVGQWVGLVQSH